MGVQGILAQIDREIAQLERARAMLSDGIAAAEPKTKSMATAVRKPKKKKRNLSPEGRERSAEAVKRRRAEQKKSASAK